MTVPDLISRINKNTDSKLNPQCQSEALASTRLPSDLHEFYLHHDGGELFSGQDYCWKIRSFSEIKRHDDVFDSFDCNGSLISQDWLIFLEEPNYKTPYAIDLNVSRFGFCYQVSRYDYPYIITTSFAEMLGMIIDLGGNYPPWYQNGYQYYGDPCTPLLRK